MSESITFTQGAGKATVYQELLPQLEQLIGGEPDLIANLANISAVLKEAFGFFWVGFYLVQSDELVLGPFQGSLACTRIRQGKGVCGTAWETGQTILVPDVDQFPGHIACSSASRSEIVVPIQIDGAFVGVLDVDSDQLNDFDETDVLYLEKLALLIGQTHAH
jgi:GAF domain-containing protein